MVKRESFGWESANVALLRPAAAGLRRAGALLLLTPRAQSPDRSAGQTPTRVGVETHPAFAGHAYAWTRNAKEDWLLEIRIGNRANDAGWVASGDRVGGDIFGYDGAGADDDAVTQGDSFENDGARADKATATDFDRLGVF